MRLLNAFKTLPQLLHQTFAVAVNESQPMAPAITNVLYIIDFVSCSFHSNSMRKGETNLQILSMTPGHKGREISELTIQVMAPCEKR